MDASKKSSKSNLDLLIKYIEVYPEFKRLYWILDKKGEEGITAKALREEHNFSDRTYKRLKKFEELEIITKIKSKERSVKYILDDKYRSKTVDHLIFFNTIQKYQKGVLYGDAGDLAIKGLYTRQFFNNHSLYGFPKIYNENDECTLTEFEFQILIGLLSEVDDVFERLKRFKFLTELHKKIKKEKWPKNYKFPQGVISEKLLLRNIISIFSKSLYEILEQDSDKSSSYKFLIDLYYTVCKLAKKHNLWLGNHPYPEKEFINNTPFFYMLLFASNPDFAIEWIDNRDKYYDPFKDTFDLIEKKGWFYDNKNIKSLERIEKEIKEDADKILRKGTNCDYDMKIASTSITEISPLIYLYEKEKGKQFYNAELEMDDTVALLSTNSIIESSLYKKNIDIRLDYYFNNWFMGYRYDDYKSLKDSELKVYEMETLVRSIIKNTNKLTLERFRKHNLVNKYFSEPEIELMISIFRQAGKKWRDRHECEYYLWYSLYDKGGIWYDPYVYELAGEIVEKNLDNWEETLKVIHEYNQRLPLKGKGYAFECYVNARIFYEKEKPIKDKEQEEREKKKKFKYKVEVRDFKDLFSDDFL